MVDTLACAACGTANERSRKYCGECGAALALACPACGTPNAQGVKFCGECGAALSTRAAPASRAAERRLVSVLFADLVGFTSASERRDAEDTRELLTRYFDTARTVAERYGGTVEKFIGDAVMAVWGAPVAREDDAERAVRAALELVSSVAQLDPALRARAGVLTGEAAITIGAEGQGMVAGDLVNTASRVQAVAAPGEVLVGEATRRASEAAIAYEEAGAHELKGKTEPLALSRALRVVANRGGEGRAVGLEAPFVGRDRELRLVKELFHTVATDGKAHFALVTGIAGIGKSRLAWEFEKYVDGLVETVYWHRGRCPAYGEGVAYWALAEMVRGRARIVESEDPESAAAKLTATVEEHVATPDDRDWVATRLQHLLGLEESPTHQREDLFAAWRLFFESVAADGPVVLVFEDLQWADAGLLDFVEYLLEWSRNSPIFVVGLARPELTERRPGFGASSRGFTALALEPLAPEAMGDLLAGLVPGLPDDLRTAIQERAEGVPLYAVETVRMLLDQGRLARDDGTYRVVEAIEGLAVPETLHALVASRLDGLDPEERDLVQNASVLGKTFVRAALASTSGRPEEELDEILRSLVRKEILFLEADPRSPERGQYGFLQDLVRHVAYETLARRDRKARHIAAASFFEQSWGGREQEVVEVVASHYVTAYELEPDADDASELQRRACMTLARAGERASSLGASTEAATLFARAAELAEGAVQEAVYRRLAGNATAASGRLDEGAEQLARAIDLLEEAGETHMAARASADLGLVEFQSGRLDQAIERMERAFAVLGHEEPDEDLAFLAMQLGRFHWFVGNDELSRARNQLALDAAERLRLIEVIAHALSTAGLLASRRRHWETALALIGRSLELGLEHGLPHVIFRGYANLAAPLTRLGNYAEAEEYSRRGVELARKIGDRAAEQFHIGNLASYCLERGRWDDVVELDEQRPAGLDVPSLGLDVAVAAVARHRGDPAAAGSVAERIAALEHSASIQDRVTVAETRFHALMAAGDAEGALETLERAGDEVLDDVSVRLHLAEAASAVGRMDRVAEILAGIDALGPAGAHPVERARTARYRAALAATEGDHERAEVSFKSAAAALREYDALPQLAFVEVEHAEWLTAIGRGEEAGPLLAEAREILARLRARPWLERLAKLDGLGVEEPALVLESG